VKYLLTIILKQNKRIDTKNNFLKLLEEVLYAAL